MSLHKSPYITTPCRRLTEALELPAHHQGRCVYSDAVSFTNLELALTVGAHNIGPQTFKSLSESQSRSLPRIRKFCSFGCRR